FTGVRDISLGDLFDPGKAGYNTLVIARIPRTVTLVLAGVGMSVSGLIMQQVTQNHFVSPVTAGTLDAAKMGLVAAYLLLPQASLPGKLLLAFFFTFVASLLFLLLINRMRYRNAVIIPLVGLMFGGIISSITSFFAYRYNIVQNLNAWMLGDFSSVLQGSYELVYIILPVVTLTYLYANKFTVVGMGEAHARNLGLDYRAVVALGMFLVSVTVSVIFITVGAIPFLGLIAPNIIRLRYGDNLRKTLPLIAIFGALFLLVCDIIGRVVITPFEMPIGIIVGIAGAVIFLVLLQIKKKP
ncbi:MAG: iron chelate uptake ABC transporter family permease subunit, partial [Flavihumibacter sp.]